ncbi:MAG: sulfite exporter TauE/SafE family protein [Ramlibacter sp.]
MDFALVLVLGLVAGTVGGIVGFGTSIMLMPALVLVYGPRLAVPIMAIASIIANASRAAAWWREIEWRTTLLVLPPGVVEAVLGMFFIAMIPVRRWMARQDWKLTRRHLGIVGAGIGFLTGIVASTGPLNTSFFLMRGLVKDAFLGKRFVMRIDPRRFTLMMDGLLLAAGAVMIWAAVF